MAALTVVFPPSIDLQPSAMTVAPGAPVTFGVAVAGTGPLSYQWRRNGANIPGATNSAYTIQNVQVSDGGSYSVVVGNAAAALTSQSANLVVHVPELRPGDDFVDRMTMPGPSGELTFNNGSATREPGEPDHAGKVGSRSVWYQWRATANGVARLSLAGSSFDTLLGVYVGETVDSLTSVAQDDDSAGFLASAVEFNVVADTTYRIAIDGFGGAEGVYVLSWDFDEADALPVITSQPASVIVPIGGEASFTVGSDGTLFQWFFNGEPIAGAINPSLTVTNAGSSHAGSYRVRVDRGGASVDSAPALLEVGPPSAAFSQSKFEDLFNPGGGGGGRVVAAASAPSGFVPVSAGAVDSRLLNNRGSTTQPGEPNHCGVIGGASRWFGLQPTADGVLAIDTIGSSIDTVLAVYTGSDLLRLEMVACDDNSAPGGLSSQVRFPAVAGTSYAVVIDGVNGAEGAITLNWRLGAVPAVASAPVTRAFPPGHDLLLMVDLENATPDTFVQWQRDGRNLFAATYATLQITNLQALHAGTYSVVVGNFAGSATNMAAVVRLASPVDLAAELTGSGGEHEFRLRAPASEGFVVQISTDFNQWTSIYTNTELSVLEYIDTTVTNRPMRFFRLWPGP